MALIQLEGISKEYIMGDSSVVVLANVHETFEAGELVALTGASGAGKSTLMNIIGGLDLPTGGKVFFEGADIYSMSENELNKYRGNEIGFVFQHNYLLDEFSAVENVMLPMLIAGGSETEALSKASNLLTEVGLSHRLSHFPSELSGGEQQRVAVARALINSPKMILADEPTGNLDKANTDAVMEILSSLSQKGVLVVIVTHDEDVASRCTRRIRLVKQ